MPSCIMHSLREKRVPKRCPWGTIAPNGTLFSNYVYETVPLAHWGTEIAPLRVLYYGQPNSAPSGSVSVSFFSKCSPYGCTENTLPFMCAISAGRPLNLAPPVAMAILSDSGCFQPHIRSRESGPACLPACLLAWLSYYFVRVCTEDIKLHPSPTSDQIRGNCIYCSLTLAVYRKCGKGFKDT